MHTVRSTHTRLPLICARQHLIHLYFWFSYSIHPTKIGGTTWCGYKKSLNHDRPSVRNHFCLEGSCTWKVAGSLRSDGSPSSLFHSFMLLTQKSRIYIHKSKTNKMNTRKWFYSICCKCTLIHTMVVCKTASAMQNLAGGNFLGFRNLNHIKWYASFHSISFAVLPVCVRCFSFAIEWFVYCRHLYPFLHFCPFYCYCCRIIFNLASWSPPVVDHHVLHSWFFQLNYGRFREFV